MKYCSSLPLSSNEKGCRSAGVHFGESARRLHRVTRPATRRRRWLRRRTTGIFTIMFPSSRTDRRGRRDQAHQVSHLRLVCRVAVGRAAACGGRPAALGQRTFSSGEMACRVVLHDLRSLNVRARCFTICRSHVREAVRRPMTRVGPGALNFVARWRRCSRRRSVRWRTGERLR